MTNIYIDIETIAGKNHMVAKIRNEIAPPATYKKQETIDKWYEEKSELVIAEKVAKLALKPHYCQIVCIGTRIGDGEYKTWSGMDEFKILRSFLDYLDKYDIQSDSDRWVGHNIINFDLPVLRAACLRNRQFPSRLPKLQSYNKTLFVLDTLKILQHQYQEFTGLGLDDLAQQYLLETKTDGVDGSHVAEMVAMGQWKEIEEYCARDVELVYNLSQLIVAYYI